VAVPLTITEGDSIDRANSPRAIGQFVEQRDHRLLERECNIEARESDPLRRSKRGLKLIIGPAAISEIEKSVDQMQSKSISLTLMHPRRAAFENAAPDKA